ncbi:hypothetical protein LTR53_015115 [Teratosphaeriaceae sp. CCFEE 6253]|nr:hypothetical protein LTR53_015115 [Teratosphaeriaceae sp. CCFEE 6253]
MAPKRKRKATKVAGDGNEGTTYRSADPKRQQDKPPGSDIHAPPPKVTHFNVPYNDKSVPCEHRGSSGPKPSLIFTHGASGGLSAPAASEFADGFAEVSPISSFQGNMNLTSRERMFGAVCEHVEFSGALGGRSLGARAAVVAASRRVGQTEALVLVSFPLVGSGKGKKGGEEREGILLDIDENVDVLFISGDRDSMCPLANLRDVIRRMKAKSWLVAVEGADHGMSWSPKHSVSMLRKTTGSIAANWLKERDEGKRSARLSWSEDLEDLAFSGWQVSDETVDDLSGTSKEASGVAEDEPAVAEEAPAADGKQPAVTEDQPPARKRMRGKT